ncbi:MAG: hypothetical protein GY861_17350 [bacterium]|nr:hypothetical protein [bacterium]
MTESIQIDYNKPTEKAEKQKATLENKGLMLISTQQTGFNKFTLTYGEPENDR